MQQSETDEELLNKWFDGESNAFDTFFLRHSGRVMNYCMKKGLPREDAEEIVQRTFIKLSHKINQYEKGRPALPWLYTVVLNELRDHIKAKVRYVRKIEKLAGAPSCEPENQSTELEILYAAAEKELSSEALAILKLRTVEEKSFEQVSHQVGKNEAATRKIFQRAVAKLRSWFRERKEEDV